MTRASSTSDIKLWLYCLRNAFGTPNRLATWQLSAEQRTAIDAIYAQAHSVTSRQR